MTNKPQNDTSFSGIFAAFIGASLTPIVIISVLASSTSAIFFASVVTFLHVAVLALPMFLLLRRLHLISAPWILCCGGLIGAVPFAVISWPMNKGRGASYLQWDGNAMVTSLSNGHVTAEGWREYVVSIGYVAVLGLISAIVFWLVLRLANIKRAT